MSTKQIHVFISHAWARSEHYKTLASWVFDEKWSYGQASLDFRNYSVPKDDPIHDADDDDELQKAIYRQVAMSHVIVIPTGMYTHYSRWIKEEIACSTLYAKPVLAVNPWGQQRASGVVVDASTKLVGWNKESVVNGIWELYKQ